MHSLSQTRRGFLAALTVPATLLTAAKKREVSIPPNILLLLADDLPANMLSAYGNADLKTPNVDALARRGVRFQNAFVSSTGGATGRATLLSGRISLQHGISADLASDTAPGPFAGEVLLTDLLSAKGYDVGYVGAWGLGNDRQPGHGIRWAYTLGGDRRYLNGEVVQESGDLATALTQRAAQFLDQQRADGKPFFLTISHPRSGGVAAIDGALPVLIAKLRERAIESNTMLVLSSGGGTIENPRAPLVYCWPGRVPVQAVRPELVGTFDFLPTICEAVGIELPDRNLCGRSYLPLVTGKPLPKKKPWRTIVYGEFEDSEMAVDNRFKLLIREDRKGGNQLFDLRADPKQIVNQYRNPAFITSRDLLRRQLNQWRTRYSKQTKA